MEEDSEAFWCFAALMERLGPNFNRDQSGMHAQLFALSKVFSDGSLFIVSASLHIKLIEEHSYTVFLIEILNGMLGC